MRKGWRRKLWRRDLDSFQSPRFSYQTIFKVYISRLESFELKEQITYSRLLEISILSSQIENKLILLADQMDFIFFKVLLDRK